MLHVSNEVKPVYELVGVPPQPAQGADLKKLQAVLDRFEVTIAEANDLVVLSDYEVVVIADDSGSMSLASAPPAQRVLGQPTLTRWDELKETVGLIVEMGACFDSSGIDIFFLNRPKIQGVKSSRDTSFVNSFSNPPRGSTPLTECLRTVASQCGGEKPVLLFILTDGEPNGGTRIFGQELRQMVNKVSTRYTFKVQIMPCTSDDDAVAWLNVIDREFAQVDVTDDYYSEKGEVIRAGRAPKFTRGDWCLKAMLGPISQKFDEWDEGPRFGENVECDLCAIQ
mmetsp:Transcript_110243/g.246375  ORF Transcript_110243/g.246375 Transcript_110243/m.246375 type:complete len:282 (-) Transcript_110243:199-1044(-)